MRTRKDKSPLAETRDVDVIRIRLQAGLLDRLRDAPERVAGKHRRGALHDHQALRAEMAGCRAIEGGGVKLAERIVGGVWKIDDDEIETVGVRINPRESIRIHYMNARRKEGFIVELREHRMRGKQFGHLRIEIDERDAFDLGIFQDFAHSEAVAAAEDKNVARRGNRSEARVDKSFVIAVLIARAELQMAVEKKPKVVFEASEDEMLVTGVARKDDVVGVDVVFSGRGDAASLRHANSQGAYHYDAADPQHARGGKLRGKQIRGPKGNTGVYQTEKHCGADEAKTRHEENREK